MMPLNVNVRLQFDDSLHTIEANVGVNGYHQWGAPTDELVRAVPFLEAICLVLQQESEIT